MKNLLLLLSLCLTANAQIQYKLNDLYSDAQKKDIAELTKKIIKANVEEELLMKKMDELSRAEYKSYKAKEPKEKQDQIKEELQKIGRIWKFCVKERTAHYNRIYKIFTNRPVTSTELDQIYKENEIRAEKIFKGKHIYLIGEVQSVRKQLIDGYRVSFLGSDFTSLGVHCHFDESKKAFLSELRKGQKIGIRGVVGDSTFGLSINDCMKITTWE